MSLNDYSQLDILESYKEIAKHLTIGQKLSVIKFDEETQSPSYPSYVKDLSEDGLILIDHPSKGSDILIVRPEDEIEIFSIRKECVWQGLSTVVKLESGRINGIWITYPETLTQIQRREYLRLPLEFPAEIYNSKAEIAVQCINLCCGGVAATSKAPIELLPDTRIKFKLNEKEMDVKISFIHIEYDYIGKQYITGFKFEDLNIRTSDQIYKIIFKEQIEMKRKGLI